MKSLLSSALSLLAAIILTTSCSSKKNDFKRYVSGLETLKTPVSFYATGIHANKNASADEERLPFGRQLTDGVNGKLFEDEKFTAIISKAGGMNFPLLITYDQDGQKIDSLNLFLLRRGPEEGETSELITINSDKTIQVVDSITSWMAPTSESEPTIKMLSVDTVVYVVDGGGRITKR
jgi:hypothetical protein